ncbi:hypothetical protein Nepgr_030281 [Nepenthes gracilis]|uniref:Uncharacterized protein n=1 Tax=Nepenthes gracilis TaxID=150966 RepID=A0AAD3Y421_NEPGR|nr:hypothetical protein Nepgr_030281 [Nepenthes gracilis]
MNVSLALEAFSPSGFTVQGVTLLPSPPDASRFVIGAFVGRQGGGEQRRGKQPNALQALGNITGKNHPQNASLNEDAEEHLRLLIYEVGYRRSKLTLLGLCLSILQQESEICLAGYRVISGLVARPWCFMEIYSKQRNIHSFWCLLCRPLCRLRLIFGISRIMPLPSKCINPVMEAQTNSAIGLAFFNLGFPRADSYVGTFISQILLVLKFAVYLQAVSISGRWIF